MSLFNFDLSSWLVIKEAPCALLKFDTMSFASGLRRLGVLMRLEELNIAYNCHISDLTILEWANLTNLRVLNLEACSNIANRQG